MLLMVHKKIHLNVPRAFLQAMLLYCSSPNIKDGMGWDGMGQRQPDFWTGSGSSLAASPSFIVLSFFSDHNFSNLRIGQTHTPSSWVRSAFTSF